MYMFAFLKIKTKQKNHKKKIISDNISESNKYLLYM